MKNICRVPVLHFCFSRPAVWVLILAGLLSIAAISMSAAAATSAAPAAQTSLSVADAPDAQQNPNRLQSVIERQRLIIRWLAVFFFIVLITFLWAVVRRRLGFLRFGSSPRSDTEDERCRVEEALKGMEARYRNLFERSPVSIWEEDFSRVGEWFDELHKQGVEYLEPYLIENPEAVEHAASLVEIKRVNDAGLKLLGHPSKDDILGNFQRIFQEETRSIFIEELKAFWENKDSFILEHEGKRKDGSPFYYILHISAPMVDGKLNLSGVVAAITDITSRKQAELLRADVESITRHDLRSQLSVVIGVPGLMLNDPNLTPKQIRMLHMVEESGLAMQNIINSSLSILKMEQGSYTLEPRPTDLIPVLHKVLERFEDNAREKQLRFLFTADDKPISEAEPFIIRGEEILFITMFSNLIGNAVDASPENETVTINLSQDAADMLITIHNKGAVPEEIRGKFFEKYVTARKSGGTGLGTYSAMLMAKAHSGIVEMQTHDDHGTTITVRLPRPK